MQVLALGLEIVNLTLYLSFYPLENKDTEIGDKFQHVSFSVSNSCLNLKRVAFNKNILEYVV